MMKRFVIWTHTDADGYLSGYIADNYIKDNPFVKSDILYYNYNGICKEWNDIADEELKEATIVICDLSICDDIREIIARCVTCGAEKIIHIDHHETSLKWMKENTDPLPEIYYTFFDKRVSAAFLCWVYSFIKPEHIALINNIWNNPNPENVWDYSENESHFMLGDGNRLDVSKEYKVPEIVRLVSDNDIWEHKFPESQKFSTYFSMCLTREEKSADSPIWDTLVRSEDIRYLRSCLDEGEKRMAEEDERSEVIRNRTGFEITFDGMLGYCVNTCLGNSRIFGDEYNTHDFVCKWSFDGSKYFYTFYTHDPDKYDMSKICARYGGGGHRGAAGCNTPTWIFNDKQTPKKKGSWLKRLFHRKK